MNQYLIAANSKKGQLIFNIFRPVDLIIAICGCVTTIILFLVFNPGTLTGAVLTLLPLAVCAFLVIPVANYHNMLCVISNIYKFYFVEQRRYVWRGWCAKDEFKD